MLNRFKYLPLQRVFCLVFFLICHFTNSISNNVSTKCYRRGYSAARWKPTCDVEQSYDVVTKVNGETIKEFKQDMQLPRIDPVEVCMILIPLLRHIESSVLKLVQKACLKLT